MSLPQRFITAVMDTVSDYAKRKAQSDLTTLASGFDQIGYKAAGDTSGMRFSGFGGGSGIQQFNNLLFDYLSGRYSGSRINYKEEVGDLLQSSLVLVPIKWLARVLPEAPIYLSRQNESGKEMERIFRHEAIDLLNRPNPYYGGKLLWAGFAASVILDSNVYFRKVRASVSGMAGRKKVAQLWYLPHYQMKACWPTDGSEFISHYERWVDGYVEKIPVEDIIHFRDGIDPRQERSGLPSIGALLREVYGDGEAANVMAALFRNGGLGGLIISPKEPGSTIRQEEAERAGKELLRKTTGDERFKPRFAMAPVDVHQTNFSPKDMNLAETRRFPEERTASLLPGNGYVLGFGAHLAHSIYNNVSESRRDAMESSVKPLLSYIEDELDAQYLPEFTEDQDLTFEHDYSNVGALQEDRDKVFTRTSIVFRAGIVDRYRAKVMIGEEPDEADKGVYASAGMPKEPKQPVPMQPVKANGHAEMTEEEIDLAAN